MSEFKKRRLLAGLTQKQLADLVGLTPKYISLLEVGARRPSIDIAIKIAKILNVTVEDIFLPSLWTKGEKIPQKETLKIGNKSYQKKRRESNESNPNF